MFSWKAVAARWRWEAALAACIVVSLGVLALWEFGHQRLSTGYSQGLQSIRAASLLGDLRALVVDAETGQRGFLLTRRDAWLVPYDEALKRIRIVEAELRRHYATHSDHLALERFAAVVAEIGSRVKEMEFIMRLAREGRDDQYLDQLNTDVGRIRMEQIRQGLAELQASERDRTTMLVAEWRSRLALSRLGMATIIALNIALLILVLRWLKQYWQRGEERAQELDRLVSERTEQLARLSAYLQEVSENEKTHLGRELHDELGAILTATRMDLLWVRARLAPDQGELLEKLKRAMNNLDQGISVKRRIIEDLRPSILSSFGLMTAARSIAEQTAERAGWQLELDLPPTDPDLDEDIEIAMFRILQEALNNASKYACATRVRVSLHCVEGESCRLEIEDNGIGFDSSRVHRQGHGLVGMRQRLEPRGGSLTIHSAPGKGTLVRAILPFRRSDRREPAVSHAS